MNSGRVSTLRRALRDTKSVELVVYFLTTQTSEVRFEIFVVRHASKGFSEKKVGSCSHDGSNDAFDDPVLWSAVLQVDLVAAP